MRLVSRSPGFKGVNNFLEIGEVAKVGRAEEGGAKMFVCAKGRAGGAGDDAGTKDAAVALKC